MNKKATSKVKKMPVVAEEVKVESKYTLEEAAAEMAKRQQEIAQEKQIRLQEFDKLLKEAMIKTNCSLRVNPNSPLNQLEIIAVVND